MKLIRLNCFETNSSSTHCLIITDENTFEKTDNFILMDELDE